MGKTSLLRWVERTVYQDRPVIWLDPSRGVTPVSMVQSIARALGKPERWHPDRRWHGILVRQHGHAEHLRARCGMIGA
jgi:hypothetical protein